MNTQTRCGYMTLIYTLIVCTLILTRTAPAQRGEPQLVKPLRAAPSLAGAESHAAGSSSSCELRRHDALWRTTSGNERLSFAGAGGSGASSEQGRQ